MTDSGWTPDEDAALRAAVAANPPSRDHPWSAVVTAAGLTGRSGKSARLRWINHLDTSVSWAPWTVEEDTTILRERERLGNRWATIAHMLPGRTDNQVKNRYHAHLKKGKPPGSVPEATGINAARARGGAAAAPRRPRRSAALPDRAVVLPTRTRGEAAAATRASGAPAGATPPPPAPTPPPTRPAAARRVGRPRGARAARPAPTPTPAPARTLTTPPSTPRAVPLPGDVTAGSPMAALLTVAADTDAATAAAADAAVPAAPFPLLPTLSLAFHPLTPAKRTASAGDALEAGRPRPGRGAGGGGTVSDSDTVPPPAARRRRTSAVGLPSLLPPLPRLKLGRRGGGGGGGGVGATAGDGHESPGVRSPQCGGGLVPGGGAGAGGTPRLM